MLTNGITQLENGFSAVKYSGADMFDRFLQNGGASSDREVAAFLMQSTSAAVSLNTNSFGCSTLSVKGKDGGQLFGRNFDWQTCNALVVISEPTDGGYSSISTVNTNFIGSAYQGFDSLPENVKAFVSLYAPLDGMNEKGLCAAVLMIQDSATINQQTDKPDITTTTAIRLILNKAANVDEAIELLRQYDMHASFGYMVHFALSDNSGKSVIVEYIDNEMVVTETPAATNFYFAEGAKHGIGTSQSHTRYDILMNTLAEKSVMDMTDVKNALDSVSKDNFGEFESTEWSTVYNQQTGEVQYYHRENYNKAYTFYIN